MMIKAGVLTISDKGFKGQRKDESGPLVAEILTKAGYIVEKQSIVPDDFEKIVECLITWVDKENLRLIVTTGGTGVSPTDITPEAMLKVIKYQIPGMAGNEGCKPHKDSSCHAFQSNSWCKGSQSYYKFTRKP